MGSDFQYFAMGYMVNTQQICTAMYMIMVFTWPMFADELITDVMSPVVSYQYQEDFGSTALANGGIMSPVVSYHYFEWPGDDILHLISSPPVSYSYPFIDGEPMVAFVLSFPLPNRNAGTAKINSVFDHSMTSPYSVDGIVTAYTGEQGRRPYGADYVTTINGKALYGFKNAAAANFSIKGNYDGGGNKAFLYYDGHPGIDFKTTDQSPDGRIDVLAVADGVAHWVLGSDFNTIRIDHGNGYTTLYLHLSERLAPDGAAVVRGQVIGKSGDAGAAGSPHLHFEVQFNGVPVDPYGWQGTGSDPYTLATNRILWAPYALPTVLAPSPPQNPRVTSVGNKSVALAWDPPANDGGSPIKQYKIFRGTVSGEETLYYTTLTTRTTFNNIANLENDVTYYYQVKAVNAIGNSDFSNEISATPVGGSLSTNHPPSASYTYTANGLAIAFTSTSSDPDNDIVSSLWNFGDGAVSTLPNNTHTYAVAGNYRVVLTVKDAAGRISTRTEQVDLTGEITQVEHPALIARAVPLIIRVRTTGAVDINLSISTFNQTLTGTLARFVVNTATFDTGIHEILIMVGNSEHRSNIQIYDGDSYQIVAMVLDDLQQVAEAEMRDTANQTSDAFLDLTIEKIIDLSGQAVVDKLLSDTLSDVKNGFESQLLNLNLRLQEVGVEQSRVQEFAASINKVGINKLGDYATKLIDVTLQAPGLISGNLSIGNIKRLVTENITGPLVYQLTAEQEFGKISERTAQAQAQISRRFYSAEELAFLGELIPAWSAAIANTDREIIYRLDLGTIPIINKKIQAQPTMKYFQQELYRSLNPGGIFGLGKYNPDWVIDMTIADVQSLLTIPAELDWIDVTPEDEIVSIPRILPALIPLLIKGVTLYIKLVGAIEKITPAVITGGMFVATDLLAKEIDEEHQQAITEILSYGTEPSISSQGLTTGADVTPLTGRNVVMELTPDGKVVGVRVVNVNDEKKIKPPPEKRIVSLKTGQSYRGARTIAPDITVEVLVDQESYNIGDSVQVNVRITNHTDAALDELLLWLFVPVEELAIKKTITLEAQSEVIETYDVAINYPGLHILKAYVTSFDESFADDYTAVAVGDGEQKGVVMTVDHEDFYTPGIVAISVMLDNVGREPLALKVDGGDGMENLPVLQAGEKITKTYEFDYDTPGVYQRCFTVKEGENPLDSQCVEFTVTAWDTLFAYPQTDKLLYNPGETVEVSVPIKNSTFQEVFFPVMVRIKTPAGETINETSFTSQGAGTYLIEAWPQASGYATVTGSTLFVVERQSELNVDTVVGRDTAWLQVTTDVGGVVQGVRVVVNGATKFTDEKGRVVFSYNESPELMVMAEKIGFDPSIERVIVTPDLPAPPTLDPFPAIIGRSSYIITGNKDANTAIYINGEAVVPINTAATWSYEVVLTNGENLLNITARNQFSRMSDPLEITLDYEFATLGGMIWYDQDGDGIRDDEETGLAGVMVTLSQPGEDGQIGGGDDGVIATVVTDDIIAGRYRFNNLDSGSYYLEVTRLSGYDFSPIDQGGDDSRDSDVDPATGRTPLFFINPGQNDFTIDAGLIGTPEIKVEGDGQEITNGNQTPTVSNLTDFGYVDIAGGSLSNIFTIRNSGLAALNLTGNPKVQTSGSSAFSVITQPTSPVMANGGTTSFELRLTPSVTGNYTGTVSIANDDADENPFTFAVKGIGVYPDIDNDKLPNHWEFVYFGSLIAGQPGEDTDHDGYLNITEYIYNADPTDPDSRPEGTLFEFIDLHRGWNLISVPVAVNNPTIERVFYLVVPGNVWGWNGDGHLVQLSIVNPLQGVWIYLPIEPPYLLQVVGDPPISSTYPLQPGWNVVGPMEIMAVPGDGRLDSNFWFWNGRRFQTVTHGKFLEPGKGYFVHANMSFNFQVRP